MNIEANTTTWPRAMSAITAAKATFNPRSGAQA